MGGLTESKRRTCRRNHCPPSDVWRAWLPSAHPCAAELHAACRLSLTLGCETGRCLQAVAESLKRQRLLDDLRANAFAMPKATVKLLMALPQLTVLLGEGMGAHPLTFLFSGVRGWTCLGFACVCYGFGLVWIRALMRQDDMDGKTA